MPAGRPSSYKPEYCDLLIEHCQKGFSFESFAGVTRTSYQTLYNWAEAHPEFLEAKKEAETLSRLFWEAQGIEGLYDIVEVIGEGKERRTITKKLNATVWIFNMKNRHGWRDNKDSGSTGDAPVTITIDGDDAKF